MPEEKIKGSPIDIMKAISMFDVETDYEDTEAREKLDILFHNLIMSDDPKAKEFFDRFLKGVTNVIADMGIIDKPEEEEPVDDVELPDEAPEDATEEEPTEEEPIEEPAAEEEPTEGEPEEEEPVEDEVPDELLGAGYNRLINHANSFLYS